MCPVSWARGFLTKKVVSNVKYKDGHDQEDGINAITVVRRNRYTERMVLMEMLSGEKRVCVVGGLSTWAMYSKNRK